MISWAIQEPGPSSHTWVPTGLMRFGALLTGCKRLPMAMMHRMYLSSGPPTCHQGCIRAVYNFRPERKPTICKVMASEIGNFTAPQLRQSLQLLSWLSANDYRLRTMECLSWRCPSMQISP